MLIEDIVRNVILSEIESMKSDRYHEVIDGCSWRDIDFKEGEVDEEGLEHLIVTVKGIELPDSVINLKAQNTRLGKIQLHTMIGKDYQRTGFGTKVYTAFIHAFGSVYSGFGRVLNPDGVMGIYRKLNNEPDINVNYIMDRQKNKPIGIEAVLNESVEGDGNKENAVYDSFQRETGYFNVKEMLDEPSDISSALMTNHANKYRYKRGNFYGGKFQDYGEPLWSFIVDTGHPNGDEIHTITEYGYIVIQNQESGRVVTVLAARPAQVCRYWRALGISSPNDAEFGFVIKHAQENKNKGLNHF